MEISSVLSPDTRLELRCCQGLTYVSHCFDQLTLTPSRVIQGSCINKVSPRCNITNVYILYLPAMTASNPHSTPLNHLTMIHLSRHQSSNNTILNLQRNVQLTSWMPHLLLPGTCLHLLNIAASETKTLLPCGVKRTSRISLFGSHLQYL